MYLINTFLGFLMAQLYDVFRRNKYSDNSPTKFSLNFFFKDNWQKMLISILLSLTISLAVHLNIKDFGALLGKDWTSLNQIAYLIIGAVPELVLQHFKKKIGLFQPDEVNGFNRK